LAFRRPPDIENLSHGVARNSRKFCCRRKIKIFLLAVGEKIGPDGEHRSSSQPQEVSINQLSRTADAVALRGQDARGTLISARFVTPVLQWHHVS
jgi:hypothetical protein